MSRLRELPNFQGREDQIKYCDWWTRDGKEIRSWINTCHEGRVLARWRPKEERDG